VADCPGNFGRRTEEMRAAHDVGKGLVDGNPLDEGREIVDHLDGGIAQPLVVFEMAADKNELRTDFARLPSWHAAAHPEVQDALVAAAMAEKAAPYVHPRLAAENCLTGKAPYRFESSSLQREVYPGGINRNRSRSHAVSRLSERVQREGGSAVGRTVQMHDRSMSNVRNWAVGSAITALILLGPILAFFVIIAAEMLTDMLTKEGVTTLYIFAAGAIVWGLIRKYGPQPGGSQLGSEEA
jgi:hypothetical protein